MKPFLMKFFGIITLLSGVWFAIQISVGTCYYHFEISTKDLCMSIAGAILFIATGIGILFNKKNAKILVIILNLYLLYKNSFLFKVLISRISSEGPIALSYEVYSTILMVASLLYSITCVIFFTKEVLSRTKHYS
jgi:hypothetical protein